MASHFENGQRFVRYVHADSYAPASFWPPSDPLQETYGFAFYEVALDAEVDIDTGAVVIHGVAGVPLERPVPA